MAKPSQYRDGHGRFAPDHRTRNRSIAAGAVVLAAGAGLAAAIWRGWVKMPRGPWSSEEGHKAPDLALDAERKPGDRAPEDFRPDPLAVPTGADRDALRPPAIH